MALDDLLESMDRLAEFMDKTFLAETGRRIRALGEEIQKEKNEGRTEKVKLLVARAVSYFWGWGGGLHDILFCKENDNIPGGMTAESANTIYDELLEELFFNLLFWDTDKARALHTYEEVTALYHRSWDEKREEALRGHPEAKEQLQGVSGEYPPMGFYFHWNPEWFMEWSDLAKLPVDEMRRLD